MSMQHIGEVRSYQEKLAMIKVGTYELAQGDSQECGKKWVKQYSHRTSCSPISFSMSIWQVMSGHISLASHQWGFRRGSRHKQPLIWRDNTDLCCSKSDFLLIYNIHPDAVQANTISQILVQFILCPELKLSQVYPKSYMIYRELTVLYD